MAGAVKAPSAVVGIVAVGTDGVAGDVVVGMVAASETDCPGYDIQADSENNFILVRSKAHDLDLFKLIPNMAAGIYEIEQFEVDGVWPAARIMGSITSLVYATGFVPKSTKDMKEKLSRAERFCTEMAKRSFGEDVLIRTVGFDSLHDKGWTAKKAVKAAKDIDRVPRVFSSFDDQFIAIGDESMASIATVVIFAEIVATALREINIQTLDIIYPELRIGEYHGYPGKLSDAEAWSMVTPTDSGFRGEITVDWIETLEKKAARKAKRKNGVLPPPKNPAETLEYDELLAKQMVREIMPKLRAKIDAGAGGAFYPDFVPSIERRLQSGRGLTPRQMFFLDRAHKALVQGISPKRAKTK